MHFRVRRSVADGLVVKRAWVLAGRRGEPDDAANVGFLAGSCDGGIEKAVEEEVADDISAKRRIVTLRGELMICGRVYDPCV